MGWASRYIANLQNGQTVNFRPHGNSMQGKIESGDLVTVDPIRLENVQVGDIVLCKVNGFEYLHLVKSIAQDGALQIGNNKGRINGWTRSVYGKCSKIEK